MDIEVLVVGGGPAGLAAGVELGEGGIDALVLEQRPDAVNHPRATAIARDTMALLRRWDVEDAVRREGFESEPVMSIRSSLVGMEFARIPFPDHVWTCAQDHLEHILAERSIAAGTDVRYGAQLSALRAVDGGLVATLTDTASGATHEIRTAYVIGADGAGGTVRHAAGIGASRTRDYGDWMSILFEAPLRTLTGPRPCMVYGVQNPEFDGVLVPTDAGDRWIRGIAWHPELGERVSDYDDDRCIALVRRAVGIDDFPVAVTEVRPFHMRASIADLYHAGRIVLVGDAAHIFTPSSGMGMNLAIHEGSAAGTVLVRVLRSGGNDASLDAYEASVRPIAEKLLAEELNATQVAR